MTSKAVPLGAIFHFSSRRRREVPIDAALRAEVEQAVIEVRALLQALRLPPPVNDARCRNCSLIDLCQPRAVAETERYRALLDALDAPP